MALEPLGRSITAASETRQNGKPRPMRQGFGTDAAPRMELSPQGRPRFGDFACTFTCGGDVEQDRFDTFHFCEARQVLRVHMRQGEQLRCRADEPGLIRHLPQTESDTNFLIRDRRVVRRERGSEITLVMLGPPFHRSFQVLFGQALPGLA
jgi:hypothetical protein